MIKKNYIGSEPFVTIVIGIVMSLMLAFIVINIAVDKTERVYDAFTDPMPENVSYIETKVESSSRYIGNKVMKIISYEFAQKCMELVNEITSIFDYNELNRECSRWYENCVLEIESAPDISPWNKINPTVEDYNNANYLDINCRTKEIEKLRERWEKSSKKFASYNEYEQYTLIKNACLSIIVDRMLAE
ncbi:MAG: hypothetical protein B6U88_01735 [Candidatus Aenigmarchaeota archaeon ex4484_56]|nr:MAG: hypothetical protein B6U88_01735 [Candidatus Aenigmarchaeota archaeon ex4484_56]